MWARQKNEWWPAEVLDVSEDGKLCVSFIGWGPRHNVWMDMPDDRCEDPDIVFQPPSKRRRAPERLFDEVSSSAKHMAVEGSDGAGESDDGHGTPGTTKRTCHPARRRASQLSGVVRVLEGEFAGELGTVLEGKCGYYRVQLHGTEQVLNLRSAQLDMAATMGTSSPRTPQPREARGVASVGATSPDSPPPKSTSTALVVYAPAKAKEAEAGAEGKLGCSSCRWTSCKRCRSRIMDGGTFDQWSAERERKARREPMQTAAAVDGAAEVAAEAGAEKAVLAAPRASSAEAAPATEAEAVETMQVTCVACGGHEHVPACVVDAHSAAPPPTGVLRCCGCDGWFHSGCVGVTRGMGGAAASEWRCPLCERGTAVDTLRSQLEADRVMEADLRRLVAELALPVEAAWRGPNGPGAMRRALLDQLTKEGWRAEQCAAAELEAELSVVVCPSCGDPPPRPGASEPGESVTCHACASTLHHRCAGLRRCAAAELERSGRRFTCAECEEVLAATARATAKIHGSAVGGRHDAAAAVTAEGARAIAAAASHAARRATRRALATKPCRRDANDAEVAWVAYCAARRTVRRLERAVATRGVDGGAAGDAAGGGGGVGGVGVGGGGGGGGVGWLLECDGGGDVFRCVLEGITDTLTLRAAACVCWEWAARLDRSRSAAVDALWRAATLDAPRGRLTVGAAVRSTRPGDRLRLTSGGRKGEQLRLHHPLIVSADAAAVLTTTVTLEDSAVGGGIGRTGVLRGLTIRHFYDPAIVVLGGHWVLEDCVVESSRGEQRACAGVVVRNGARVELRGCTITGCSTAALLSSAQSRLLARGCTFGNTRAAVASERGGHIEVRGCAFEAKTDVALRLAPDTTGDVAQNRGAHGDKLFGPFEPPPGVVVDAEPEVEPDF